jgi:hypothetical protein
MVKGKANRLSHEERIQLLASEIAIRAIYDLRLLQRRKVLVGEEIVPPEQRPRLTDCCCYREDENIKNLLDDFKNGSVLFWCRAGGANIDQTTLNRMLKRRKHDNGISEVLC